MSKSGCTGCGECGGLPPAEPADVVALTDYASGSIVSRTLCKKDAGTITVFAFDAGQGLSEHSAPFDAVVQVLDGRGEFTIGGRAHTVEAGQIILMPADVPHGVNAPVPMKMMLTMLRSS